MKFAAIVGVVILSCLGIFVGWPKHQINVTLVAQNKPNYATFQFVPDSGKTIIDECYVGPNFDLNKNPSWTTKVNVRKFDPLSVCTVFKIL